MSVLNTNPEQLKSVSMREQDLSYLIRQLAAETRSIRMSMDYEIRAKEEIARKLSRLEEQISEKADILRAYSDTLAEISARYLRTEKENVARLYADSADTQGVHSIIGTIVPGVVMPWIIVPPSPRPAPFIPRPVPWPYPLIPTPRPAPHIPPKPSIWSVFDWDKLRPIPPSPAPKPSILDGIDWKRLMWRSAILKPLKIQSALSALDNSL